MKRSALVLALILVVVGAVYLWSQHVHPLAGDVANAREEVSEVARHRMSEPSREQASLDVVSLDSSSSRAPLRDLIRESAERESREFRDPVAPALRSPTGATDPLQCAVSVGIDCEQRGPLVAASWDEAQWMRSRGFLDEAQLETAKIWTDGELDDRYRNGDPAAVSELARRFAQSGEELAAKKVLADAVRGGNVFAAHQRAAIDAGKSAPHYSRPGLEWMFVARQLGDGRVTISYILARYPNIQPHEIDQAMTVAERLSERLNLRSRQIERRPGNR